MENVMAWLQLYWAPLAVVGVTAVLLALVWRRQPSGSKTAPQQLLTAAQVAKELVRGAEQAWVTGKIERDERYDMVIDHLHTLFPALSVNDLNMIVEGAVYGMNEIKRLPRPKAVTGG